MIKKLSTTKAKVKQKCTIDVWHKYGLNAGLLACLTQVCLGKVKVSMVSQSLLLYFYTGKRYALGSQKGSTEIIHKISKYPSKQLDATEVTYGL